MWNWIVTNKQWVFDGFGVAIAVGILTIAGRAIARRRAQADSIRQSQRGGTGSVNVQIGAVNQREGK